MGIYPIVLFKLVFLDVASKSGSNELTTKGENVNCSYNFTVLGEEMKILKFS